MHITHQLCNLCTEGVVSSLSGRRFISFMMLDNLTGSSCLRNAKDVFSQALMDPAIKKTVEISLMSNTIR